MATSFVQLGSNDSLDAVIRKCNENFRALSADQEKSTSTAIRQESAATQLKIDAAVNDAIEQINGLLESAKEEINKKIKEATANVCPAIDQRVIYHPTGSSEPNPANVWPGTEWIDEGYWLLPKDPDKTNPTGYQVDYLHVHIWRRYK